MVHRNLAVATVFTDLSRDGRIGGRYLRGMAVVSGGFLSHSSTSGAELFSAGCFSEALNTYDTHRDEGYGRSTEGGKVPSQQSKTILNSKALYAACNRAAAKLELEMCRSCLRDCDEAICIDPFCLRAHVLKGGRRLDPYMKTPTNIPEYALELHTYNKSSYHCWFLTLYTYRNCTQRNNWCRLVRYLHQKQPQLFVPTWKQNS